MEERPAVWSVAANIYTNSRGQPTTVSSAGWGLCEVIKTPDR